MYLVLGSLVNVFDAVTVVGVVDVANVIGVPSVLSRFTPCSQCLINQNNQNQLINLIVFEYYMVLVTPLRRHPISSSCCVISNPTTI